MNLQQQQQNERNGNIPSFDVKKFVIERFLKEKKNRTYCFF